MMEKVDKFLEYVTDKKFLAGLVLGFALGALHNYFGL
jgi:hypothetical protein